MSESMADVWKKACREAEAERDKLLLQNQEWEKLIREAADNLYAFGKSIRQHKQERDPGHYIMGVATNLHRACGIVNGEKPLPAAGARLTGEETEESPFPTAQQLKIYRAVDEFFGACKKHHMTDCRTCADQVVPKNVSDPESLLEEKDRQINELSGKFFEIVGVMQGSKIDKDVFDTVYKIAYDVVILWAKK